MRRRGTYQRPPQQPWWAHPAFLLPGLVAWGLILMVIALRLLGYGE